jgi:hypothetical protein
MTSEHSHDHQHRQSDHSHGKPGRKPLHRDWRFIAAVLVMLAAITAYVLSGDEMFGLFPKKNPNNGPQPAGQTTTNAATK